MKHHNEIEAIIETLKQYDQYWWYQIYVKDYKAKTFTLIAQFKHQTQALMLFEALKNHYNYLTEIRLVNRNGTIQQSHKNSLLNL